MSLLGKLKMFKPVSDEPTDPDRRKAIGKLLGFTGAGAASAAIGTLKPLEAIAKTLSCTNPKIVAYNTSFTYMESIVAEEQKRIMKRENPGYEFLHCTDKKTNEEYIVLQKVGASKIDTEGVTVRRYDIAKAADLTDMRKNLIRILSDGGQDLRNVPFKLYANGSETGTAFVKPGKTVQVRGKDDNKYMLNVGKMVKKDSTTRYIEADFITTEQMIKSGHFDIYVAVSKRNVKAGEFSVGIGDIISLSLVDKREGVKVNYESNSDVEWKKLTDDKGAITGENQKLLTQAMYEQTIETVNGPEVLKGGNIRRIYNSGSQDWTRSPMLRAIYDKEKFVGFTFGINDNTEKAYRLSCDGNGGINLALTRLEDYVGGAGGSAGGCGGSASGASGAGGGGSWRRIIQTYQHAMNIMHRKPVGMPNIKYA